MSRKRQPSRTDRESREPDRVAPTAATPVWRTAAALVWLIGFLLFFSSFRLPNNPGVTRWEIWTKLPFLLLEVVDPLPVEGQRPPPSGWEYLPQRFDLMLVAAAILAGAWGLGHLALRAMGRPIERGVERTVFALALGLAALSLLTLACGLAGLLNPWLLKGLIAMSVVAEIGARVVEKPSRLDRRTESAPQLVELAVVCVIAAAPFLLSMALGSMLPPTDFDVKAYHLQGPKEWYQAGRISFLPHNVYTSFPFLTEMLCLLGMVLRGDWFHGALAGQLTLMTFGPLTGLALYAVGRRWFGPAAGLLAATVHLTTPWVYRISTIAYAEGGLSFYLFVALFAAGLAVERMRAGESPPRLVLLAGLLAGSAMACKYPGVVSVVIPLGLVICGAAIRFRADLHSMPSLRFLLPPFRKGGRGGWSNQRLTNPEEPDVKAPPAERRGLSSDVESAPEPPLPPLRKGGSQTLASTSSGRMGPVRAALLVGAVYAAGVLLAVGPWLVKNAVQTGNPVYPLLYTVFGGRDWEADLNEKWRRGHSPGAHDPRDLAVKFVDVIANNDWHSPLLYGLAPLSLLLLRKRRLVAGLWLYVAFLFLQWWVFTHRIDRFWVPMIPVVALLAGAGAAWSGERLWRSLGGTLIGLCVLFNLAVVTSGLSGDNAYLLDLNYARERAARITSPEIALVNRLFREGRLPDDVKLLSVGDAELFDARFPTVYNTVFDRDIFQQWTGRATAGVPPADWPLRDTAEIRRTLARHGVTHVYVNWAELLRYRQTYGYIDYVSPRRIRELQQRGILGAPIAGGPSLGDWERLSEGERQEIERWAPELITTSGSRKAWIAAEILPVR